MAMSTAEPTLDPDYFRQAAINLVKRGFHVIRLRPGGSLPKDKEYYNRAASTPEAAHSMWTDEDGFPERFNVGILTGTPLPDGRLVVAVDLDVKDGRDGIGDARALNLPATLMFRTKSGGFHMVYGVPADGSVYRSSARSKLAPGIDTRGWHGYIVAPGSIVGDASYKIHRDAPIVDAPPVIVDHMRRTPDAAPADGAARPALVALDEEHALVWAAQFLTDQPVVGVGARNDTVADWTRQLRDRALSPAAIIEAITRHTELGRDPDFAAELIKTVNSAWNSSRLPAGNKSAAADFVDLSAQTPTPPPRQRRRIDPVPVSESPRLIHNRAKPLIKGFLSQGAMSVLYGPSGAGKTFLSLDIAFHVATGLPWATRKTEQRAVLYLLGEGAQGVHARATALLRRYGFSDPPLFLVTTSVDLFSTDGDARPIVDAIKEIEDTTGFTVGLTVVDTLARAIAGGDENSSQDMGQFVHNVDLIREHSNTHVLLVHHTGKDVSRGARGSSVLRAATDTEIEVEPNRLIVTKQREMDGTLALDFRLIPFQLGIDEDNEPLTTCTVELDVPSPDDIPDQASLDAEAAAEYAEQLETGISSTATRVLDFLLARTSNSWITEKEIWNHVHEPDDVKPSTVRVRRHRAIAELKARGLIIFARDSKRLKAVK